MNDLAARLPATGGLDVEAVRADFPCLDQRIHDRPLVFLDSATSAQKPRRVIDTLSHVLRHDYANIHRGVHTLSQRATDLHDEAREKVRSFINAASSREIIFTRGGTEAINLVAQSFVRPRAKPGDEVLITTMEHHANIVPWQLLADQIGLKLVVAPINDDGEILLDALAELISERTRLVSVAWVSNALGTVNPVDEIVGLAHARGVPVLLDACQAVQHIPIDVQALDCDFLVFSGHKLYGPSGIGALYGKEALLEDMPPYQGGGDMILSVSFDGTEFNELPYKFEAGTPAIEAAVGLGAAIDYVQTLGLDNIAAHEHQLLAYATRTLNQIPGLRIIGTARAKSSVISFVLEQLHAHDVGTLLDLDGIAVRTGHHCAMPVMDRFGVAATTRASLALYNTEAEIDALAASLRGMIERFG
jgi:cysteine desulfurase/selenocysteine lyase